jgi:molybdopterin synthase sulfur carrier subunit
VVRVRIPTVMRPLVEGASTIEADGGTVREVLTTISNEHPEFGPRIFDDSGKVRRFVNVFVDDDDIRFEEGLETRVVDGQTLSILPAVAGGREVRA